MYFQLRRDADEWFESVGESFQTKWDRFYLCLMAGFASGKSITFDASAVTDLVDYYPDEFKTRGRLLVGLLLTTDLAAHGIALTERDSVYRHIAKLVRSDSPSDLTDDGVKLMNQYAYYGYEKIREYWQGDKLQTIEGFLRKYYQFIKQLAAQSRTDAESDDTTDNLVLRSASTGSCSAQESIR